MWLRSGQPGDARRFELEMAEELSPQYGISR
jgi:hypothetical protein